MSSELGHCKRTEGSFDRLLAPLVKPFAWLMRPWARRRLRETEARREAFRFWREQRGLVPISEIQSDGATAQGFRIEVVSYQPETSVSVVISGIDPALLSTTSVFRLSPVGGLFGRSDGEEGRVRIATRGDFMVASPEIEPGALATWLDQGPLARVRALRAIDIQGDSVHLSAGGLDRVEDWDALVDGTAALIEWLNGRERSAAGPTVTERRSGPGSSSS